MTTIDWYLAQHSASGHSTPLSTAATNPSLSLTSSGSSSASTSTSHPARHHALPPAGSSASAAGFHSFAPAPHSAPPVTHTPQPSSLLPPPHSSAATVVLTPASSSSELARDASPSRQAAPPSGEGKKKKHRHTRTWAGHGAQRTQIDPKAREEADKPLPAPSKAPASPYLSEEERAAFVKTPQLLNDASFEPRVIKGASPYVPKTKKVEEEGRKSRRMSNDKKRSGDELQAVAEEVTVAPLEEATVTLEEIEREKRREQSKIYSGVHRRYNSMHSLHLASVLHSPDVQEILLCFARALYGNLKLSETVAQPLFLDIYSELVHPLNEGSRRKLPSVEDIIDYVTRIYTGIALAPENLVMALAYIERLVALTNVTVHPTTWRRIVLAALLLASKVWEDLAVHNRDLLRVFPHIKLRDVLELEHAFLEHLKFTVSLKASVYAKYYFELRTLSELDEHTFPLKPLGEEGALMLEARSRGVERKVAEKLQRKRRGRRRAKSFTALPRRDKDMSANPNPNPNPNAGESPAPSARTKAIGFDAFAALTHAQRAPTHVHHRH